MVDDEKPSFILDLNAPDNSKPLPYLVKPKRKNGRLDWYKVSDHYPKFEIEFFDIIKDCAKYIDDIESLESRVKYNKQLNKVFIIRHRGLAMRLFKELVTLKMKGR
jgi:hypothetical protein